MPQPLPLLPPCHATLLSLRYYAMMLAPPLIALRCRDLPHAAAMIRVCHAYALLPIADATLMMMLMIVTLIRRSRFRHATILYMILICHYVLRHD